LYQNSGITVALGIRVPKTTKGIRMKKLSLLLTSTLLFTACSKTVKEVQNSPKTNASPVAVKNNNDLKELKAIVNAKYPNLALAELLARSIAPDHKEEIKKIVSELDAEEVRALISAVEVQNSVIRKESFYHRQNYQENGKFITKTLNKEYQVNLPTVSEQLKFSVFGYVRNKAVDEVLRVYHKRSVELSNEIAAEFAVDIGQSDPKLAKQIEAVKNSSNPAEEIRKLILKSEPMVRKIDGYFKTSDLTKDEQYTLMVTGLVAGGIYKQLEKNGDFRNIVKQAKVILQDAKAFQEKAKEIQVMLGTISAHVKSSKKDFEDLKTGIKDSVQDMKDAYNLHSKNPKDINSKRMLDFLSKNVAQGSSKKEIENISVLSEGAKLSKNFLKTAQATENITNNLSTILNNTNAIMGALKMKPSKDLAKAIDKVQKVAQVASLVKGAIVGYATGGPMGAISSLSGNPALAGLMGGGGGDSAKLDEISRKLDEVLLNQKEMMKLQHETINLIKEVALMIDSYHQTEMAALSEIRNGVLTTSEMLKTILNQDLAECEAIITRQILSVDSLVTVKTNSLKNIYNLKMNQTYFKESFSDFSKFKKLADKLGQDNLKDCLKGLNHAFDGRDLQENPIRAIFSSELDNDLFQFEQDHYLPNLNALQKFAKTDNLTRIPLHFPMTNVEALDSKTPYIDDNTTENSGTKNVYELNQLISTTALERYVSSLLILHPLIELDQADWKGSFKSIVDKFIEMTNEGSRSSRVLSNALKMTQSAIAQEAIIAGEPILHKLNEKYKDILSGKKCKEVDLKIPDSKAELTCQLRNNKLLMMNLIMFSLREQNKITDDFLNRYERFYNAKDYAQLSALFNTDLDANDFEFKDENIFLKLEVNKNANGEDKPVKIRIPTPSALRLGKILYTESMPRLIFMQDLILDELEKVTPMERDLKENDLLNLILISNQES
jgi:hypothetical protein